MHSWKLFSLTLCVLSVVCAHQQAIDVESKLDLLKSDDETLSSTSSSSSAEGVDASSGRNQSETEGSPDSHEAMNNRQLKPAPRRKRSYEFLMGLVKRNATLYETLTKKDHDDDDDDNTMRSSGLLLELLVKIAANPRQWMRIHELLQTLDADLIKSRSLIDTLHQQKGMQADNMRTTTTPPPPPPPPFAYQNFAYHRVTGNPLAFAGGGGKSPKAYIAVSVIAPKRVHDGERQATASEAAAESVLEKELQELRAPWTHQANLAKMAEMRSRWIIQNDANAMYER